jgi:hypothetical protein
MCNLSAEGYIANFAVGFDEAITYIESYLEGRPKS